MVTIVLVERGRGIVTDRHGQHETRTGDVVIFEPEAEFQYRPLRPQRISMVMIDEAMLLEMTAWRHAPKSAAARARVRAMVSALSPPVIVLRPSPTDARRLQRLLRSAAQVQSAHAEHNDRSEIPRLFTITAQILEVLDPLLLKNHPNPLFASQIKAAADLSFPRVRHSGVKRAVESMATRPAREWSVESLARQASLSPGHFSRVFTAEVGLSPRQFLSDRRLSEFIILIRTTTLSVNQAARMVGWSSTSHAISAFRRHFGITPKEYRYGLDRNADESVIDPDETPIPPPSIEPQDG